MEEIEYEETVIDCDVRLFSFRLRRSCQGFGILEASLDVQRLGPHEI